MMLRFSIVLVLLFGLLAGCGQVAVFGHTIGEQPPASDIKTGATATSDSAATPLNQGPKVQIVKSVTLVLTPQGTATVAADPRFNAAALLAAIETELKARQVLDETTAHASTAEISLDDFSMRPTSNAILFGNIISDGMLGGNMRLRDAQGNDSQNLRIDAKARVSIPATGETTNPLGPLYRQFAVLAGNILAGAPAKSTEPEFQRPR